MQIKKSSPRLPSWQPSLISFNTPIDSGSIIKPCTLKHFQVPILAPGLEDSVPVLNLRLNNVPIERIKQLDFLGLTISDTLTWKDHVNKMANKIAKSIGVMSRLKYQLDKTTLVLIYNWLVLSHFYCSILAWGFESERLLRLQKKAIRTIHRAKYNAHTKPLMKESSLLDLKDIFDIQCAKFYFKFKHGTLPSYFEKFFVQNNQIHNHFTRNRDNLHRCPTKWSRTNEWIRHNIPTPINDLPKANIDTHSLSGFTNSYKRKLLSNYPTECLVRNFYVCGRVWY